MLDLVGLTDIIFLHAEMRAAEGNPELASFTPFAGDLLTACYAQDSGVLGHADRRFLAGVTRPLWSLANSRGVLSPLASYRRLGTDPPDLVVS